MKKFNPFTWLVEITKPSEETLRAEGTAKANERFNIVEENGLSFVKYNNVTVSPAKYGNATKELIETLYDLRKMFVEQYVKAEGRL